MAATPAVQKLKGTWEYVDGEHFDDYMKELVRRFFVLFYIFKYLFIIFF
jgi:hypothetical protein